MHFAHPNRSGEQMLRLDDLVEEAQLLGLFSRVEQAPKCRQRANLSAQCILDYLDIGGRHRNADRHFVETEFRGFSGRDTEITVERCDQSAGDRVPFTAATVGRGY